MKRRMLVVDDEKGMRDMLRFFLESEDCEVDVAENGLEAVNIIRSRSFDIVFLDIHMPVMGGCEALGIVRSIRPDQKVIVFSSSSDLPKRTPIPVGPKTLWPENA